jgi:hypothetical protein
LMWISEQNTSRSSSGKVTITSSSRGQRTPDDGSHTTRHSGAGSRTAETAPDEGGCECFPWTLDDGSCVNRCS